jgi:hypothetical protein
VAQGIDPEFQPQLPPFLKKKNSNPTIYLYNLKIWKKKPNDPKLAEGGKQRLQGR